MTKPLSLIRIVAVLVLLHLTACAENAQKSAPASTPSSASQSVIIDSALSFEEAIGSQTVPEAVRAGLLLVDVRYYSFDRREHQGQLLIHKDLRREIEEIFVELAKTKFPAAKVIPVSNYGFSDELSMEDNYVRVQLSRDCGHDEIVQSRSWPSGGYQSFTEPLHSERNS